MLNAPEQETVHHLLRSHFDEEVSVQEHQTVGGGSINDAYRINTNKGSFFLKVNHASRYPRMFEVEAKGLELLRTADEILIPKVIAHGTDDHDKAYLILEFIESTGTREGFWGSFGRQLARLHKHSAAFFGLDHDNYIGSLPQKNTQHPDWPTFFAKERLGYQLKMARDAGKFGTSDTRSFENLYGKLEDLFPEEPPALIHGDLWAGNYMKGPTGEPCIMDPAVYYGHREMDLGMTTLFGGFDPEFYRAYQEEYPLEPGWEDRLDLANLYPLLVHVNLFGGAYLMEARSILKRFV